jgi:hypothetical protein
VGVRTRSKLRAMYETILTWLKTYESVAIWLEGIALVLIFIWDRIDSSQQDEISQKQVKASQEQAEAMQKPCLMLSTTARPGEDAILGMGGALGGMMLLCPGRDVQLQNVGSGPAINIRYSATPTNPTDSIARPNGYLVGMRPGEAFAIPLSCEILRGHQWDVAFTYESLSGGRYQTKSIVDDLILTNIQFGRMPNRSDSPP